ncbi:AAA family ATPase [Streptomyces rubiginosohelvolus]|uniref:ATP-dependent nuclease n=1 Tax=Streptomyces rubiginosohelvolus TaxID=67362 RepID=UPI0033BE8093
MEQDFSFFITRIKTSSGDTVEVPRAGITAIVGPNNAGKSSFLRQISSHLRHGSLAKNLENTFLINEITTSQSGDWEDFLEWLRAHARITQQPDGSTIIQRPGASTVQMPVALRHQSQNWPNGLAEMYDFIAFHGDAWQRIGGVTPVEMRDRFDNPPSSPMHLLQDNTELFGELNDISERVFGETLTMDRLSRQINLRVGKIDAETPRIDEVSEEYQSALSSLPWLTEQGDGMRSLIGLLIPLVTSTYPIVVIDEPEAFVHPPQAAALGKILGEQARAKNLQIIVATHDRHLLSGFLESSANLSIVRIERNSQTLTRFSQLNVDDVKEIWSDPVLRYSNVLDGLFHKLAVLAEADRDCRFFSSALEEYEPKSDLPLLPGDVLFVPSGGKDSLRRLATVLRSVHVPTVVSPDLDILNNRETIKSLFNSLGGNWEDANGDYRNATSAFSQPREKILVSHVLTAIRAQLKLREDEQFTAAIKNELLTQIRLKDNPWSALKTYGMLAFRGQAAVAANRLMERLEGMGIAPVRVGELECFAPDLGVSKGPAWLPAAIKGGYHRSPESRKHIQHIISAYAKVTQEPAR